MKKNYFFGIVITIGILYFYFGGRYMDKRDERYYNQFNQANLNDTIVSMERYARGIKLHFKKKHLVFYPLTSNFNNNTIFEYTAEKGDIVLKKPYEDTLLLEKKSGKFLKYTFIRPHK